MRRARGDLTVADAQSLGDAGPERFDDDVGGFRKPQDRLDPFRQLQIERDTLLATVRVSEEDTDSVAFLADAASRLASSIASILMTSAPWSAMNCVSSGPAGTGRGPGPANLRVSSVDRSAGRTLRISEGRELLAEQTSGDDSVMNLARPSADSIPRQSRSRCSCGNCLAQP